MNSGTTKVILFAQVLPPISAEQESVHHQELILFSPGTYSMLLALALATLLCFSCPCKSGLLGIHNQRPIDFHPIIFLQYIFIRGWPFFTIQYSREYTHSIAVDVDHRKPST